MNMGTSLYIHIPFCKSKCFYCSFASVEGKDALMDPYLEALTKEATGYRARQVSTVYIGGGTPSYLSAVQIKRLFELIRANFILEKDAEVTFEANPATFDLDKAKVIFNCGVNRVSLGVQSLNDGYLKFLGRPHTAADAYTAHRLLREVGFTNISLDLIYSLPAQSAKDAEADALGLVSFGSEHISLYTLSVSEGSDFHRRKIEPPIEEKQGEDYLLVTQLLKHHGFTHYEVSNFCKKGYECRHNLNYWQGGNYIGLGAAAHSHRDGLRSWNTDNVEQYLASMKNGASAKAGEEKLTEDKRFMETLLIGLRLTEGVDLKDLEERFEILLPREKEAVLADLKEHGLLEEEKGRLRATLSGMVVLDEICSRLI